MDSVRAVDRRFSDISHAGAAVRAGSAQNGQESQLALIVTNAACRVVLWSFAAPPEEVEEILSDCRTRFHPELEIVAQGLIDQWLSVAAVQSREVLVAHDRLLRFSPLWSRSGTSFAFMIDRRHTHDPLERARVRFKLTNRQTEVLSLVFEGASAGDIAGNLFISEYTAQSYIKALLLKTACRNRAAMVARVLEWEQTPLAPANAATPRSQQPPRRSRRQQSRS